jgi:hypothetical protein
MTENHENDGFSSVARSRRSFIKKFAAGAFVAPVIASFALDGMASAAPVPNFPNQGFPNQSCGNQGFGGQGFPNQGIGNQQPDPAQLREIERELRHELDCQLHIGLDCTCSGRP